VALADLVEGAGQVCDLGQLTRGRPDAHERRHRQPQGGRVDGHAEAGDHAGALQPLDPLGDGRRGHAHLAGQRGHRDARVCVQLAQQPAVGIVQQLQV